MSRVIVLGAGVIGASVAYHLALAGADVTVIEAGGPAAGTSSATFAMDVTHLKTPVSYYEFNRRSAALHAELTAELGGASWRHAAPTVQWADTAAEQRSLRDRATRLRSWATRAGSRTRPNCANWRPQWTPVPAPLRKSSSTTAPPGMTLLCSCGHCSTGPPCSGRTSTTVCGPPVCRSTVAGCGVCGPSRVVGRPTGW
ncbi:FAD-dependent oxidoreductase [Streptomyces sp. FXJ1.4098]|nr:FAD-dependent oxidoreductase [Streptomyces sp. FXJ1.4098]